jgi:molybdate transport system substrate-binding protein
MSRVLRLLSAGAAQGLATALAPQCASQTGSELQARFAPVGVIKEKLLADEACDVIVSTPSMLEEFARGGRVDRATIASLGYVHTGMAVRSSDPVPEIDTPDRLCAALCAAPRIHVPDPQRATAGIHFVKVLRKLGLHEALLARIASHANGAAAMSALAAETERGALGCTQVTEIVFTRGVSLIGALPVPFALATPYAAAVSTAASDPGPARRFVAMLAGPEAASLRLRSGFE